jgi:hypothetical protein
MAAVESARISIGRGPAQALTSTAESWFSAGQVVRTARVVVAAWVMAVNGDDLALRALASPGPSVDGGGRDAADDLLHPAGLDEPIAPGPQVIAIDVVRLEPGGDGPGMSIRWRFAPGGGAAAKYRDLVGSADLAVDELQPFPWRMTRGRVRVSRQPEAAPETDLVTRPDRPALIRPVMARPTIRYSVGNEHNPADPWGRSELVIYPDGGARLDHHFSRGGPARAWGGYVDAAPRRELLDSLERAGWPPAPSAKPVPPDAALRRLAIEENGAVREGVTAWSKAALPSGYAEAFDIIDAVIRQLSGDAVEYPTERGPVVHGAFGIKSGS